MNFFKGLQNSVNSIPHIIGGNNNKNNDYIVQLIRCCTYTDDVKFVIEKSVRQLLHVYPQYIVDKIEFAEHNIQKRYIQLKGQISVDYKGKFSLFIMYPVSFPKTPPFLRILNPNPQQFNVGPSYKRLQSKSDPRSYLLNDCLQEVKGWKPNSSVASIIIEVNDLVRTNFPFLPNNQYGQNQMWNPQGQPLNNNQPKHNQNNMWGQPTAKQPPIPFKAQNNNSQTLPRAKKMVITQKQKLAQMSISHGALLPTLQTLDANRMAIESESHILCGESERMMNFMNHSEDYSVQNFANLVSASDETSQRILDYLASVKAREQALQLLQTQFNDEEISFEQFLKIARKMEEAKFVDRFMVKEIIQNISRIH